MSHLIENGHTQIAYFSGPSHSAHSQDRFEGYRQRMVEENLTVIPEYVLTVGSNIENGYEIGRAFFKERTPRPTAVLCYNDLVAIGVINALSDLGFDVPRDVSVIGFDNIDICDSVRVPLTTVYAPAYEIGQKAAELVFRQIQNRSRMLNERIVLEPDLVVRKSVSPRGILNT